MVVQSVTFLLNVLNLNFNSYLQGFIMNSRLASKKALDNTLSWKELKEIVVNTPTTGQSITYPDMER